MLEMRELNSRLAGAVLDLLFIHKLGTFYFYQVHSFIIHGETEA
jgi:hypothetical protein